MTLAIETKKLSKTFRSGFFLKESKALSEVSLSVEPGTIFGFLGPNAAGKTTAIKLLTGLIHPTSGEGKIFGKSMRDISIKRKIGFLPERPYFYEYLTGLELLHFCGELFGMDRLTREKKIEALLDLVSLKGSERMPLRRYSKGMLQRIGLAQALINDPDLVILDEPMSGLDPVGRKEVRDIILHLKEMGKTVFFSTHILSDAEVICDQVGILIKGRLRSMGKLESLLNPQIKSIDVSLRSVLPAHIEAVRVISSDLSIFEHTTVVSLADEPRLKQLIDWARREDVSIVSIIPRKETLEDIFLDEIKEGTVP